MKILENFVENRGAFLDKFSQITIWRSVQQSLKIWKRPWKSCVFRAKTKRLEDLKKILRFLSKSFEKIQFLHYFYKIIHWFLPHFRIYIPLRKEQQFSNIIFPTSQRHSDVHPPTRDASHHRCTDEVCDEWNYLSKTWT